jgi:hypothetical protein
MEAAIINGMIALIQSYSKDKIGRCLNPEEISDFIKDHSNESNIFKMPNMGDIQFEKYIKS